jgi:hypothetical protein
MRNREKRRHARSALRDLLAKYSEVLIEAYSIAHFSQFVQQVYGVPFRGQLQSAKAQNQTLWYATQQAAIQAAGSNAYLASEFTAMFTDPLTNPLNLEAHPASQGVNPCNLLLTADHFRQVIEPDLKVSCLFSSMSFIIFAYGRIQSEKQPLSLLLQSFKRNLPSLMRHTRIKSLGRSLTPVMISSYYLCF